MRFLIVVLLIFSLVGCAIYPQVKDDEILAEARYLKEQQQLYRLQQEQRIVTMGNKLLKLFPKPLPIDFKYLPSAEINAYSSGDKIYILEGLLSYMESDSELAAIIAHEIGHSVMSHIGKKTAAITPFFLAGLILTVFTGIDATGATTNLGSEMLKPYDRSLEKEADYIGTLLAYEAGYDPNDLPKFFEKMAIRLGDTTINQYGRTHPTTPYRAAAIKKTVEALREGRLIPDIFYSLWDYKEIAANKYTLQQLESTCEFLGVKTQVDYLDNGIEVFKVSSGNPKGYFVNNGIIIKCEKGSMYKYNKKAVKK